MSKMNWLGAVVAVVGLLWATAGRAQVQYSQSFDGLTTGAINGQDSWASGGGTPQVQTNYSLSGKALFLKPNDNAYRSGIFSSQTNYPWRVAFDFMHLTNALSYTGKVASLSFQDTLGFVRGPYANEAANLIYYGSVDANSNLWSGSYLQVRGRSYPAAQQWPLTNIPTGVWFHVEMTYWFLPGTAGSADALVATNGVTVWDPPVNSTGLSDDGNVNYIQFAACPNDTLVIDNVVTEFLTPDGTIYWQE